MVQPANIDLVRMRDTALAVTYLGIKNGLDSNTPLIEQSHRVISAVMHNLHDVLVLKNQLQVS